MKDGCVITPGGIFLFGAPVAEFLVEFEKGRDHFALLFEDCCSSDILLACVSACTNWN